MTPPRLAIVLRSAATCMAIVALLVACHGRRTYHSYQAVDAQCWSATDTLRFTPDALSEDGLYSLLAGVRVNEHYPYRDLWLVVEQRTPSAATTTSPHTEHVSRDTLHVLLTDAKGNWLTQGVVLHTSEDVVTATRLTHDNPPEFLVYHIMRDQNLKGVMEVGLKIR